MTKQDIINKLYDSNSNLSKDDIVVSDDNTTIKTNFAFEITNMTGRLFYTFPRKIKFKKRAGDLYLINSINLPKHKLNMALVQIDDMIPYVTLWIRFNGETLFSEAYHPSIDTQISEKAINTFKKVASLVYMSTSNREDILTYLRIEFKKKEIEQITYTFNSENSKY